MQHLISIYREEDVENEANSSHLEMRVEIFDFFIIFDFSQRILVTIEYHLAANNCEIDFRFFEFLSRTATVAPRPVMWFSHSLGRKQTLTP
jgi:hypothetical protein